jgi:hypothetical protein
MLQVPGFLSNGQLTTDHGQAASCLLPAAGCFSLCPLTSHPRLARLARPLVPLNSMIKAITRWYSPKLVGFLRQMVHLS